MLPWKDHLVGELEARRCAHPLPEHAARRSGVAVAPRPAGPDRATTTSSTCTRRCPGSVARLAARSMRAADRPGLVSTEHNRWETHRLPTAPGQPGDEPVGRRVVRGHRRGPRLDARSRRDPGGHAAPRHRCRSRRRRERPSSRRARGARDRPGRVRGRNGRQLPPPEGLSQPARGRAAAGRAERAGDDRRGRSGSAGGRDPGARRVDGARRPGAADRLPRRCRPGDGRLRRVHAGVAVGGAARRRDGGPRARAADRRHRGRWDGRGVRRRGRCAAGPTP